MGRKKIQDNLKKKNFNLYVPQYVIENIVDKKGLTKILESAVKTLITKDSVTIIKNSDEGFKIQ